MNSRSPGPEEVLRLSEVQSRECSDPGEAANIASVVQPKER